LWTHPNAYILAIDLSLELHLSCGTLTKHAVTLCRAFRAFYLTTMPRQIARNRGWWREYFLDHPKVGLKDDSEGMVTGKPKVMCRRHLDHAIATIQKEDQEEVALNKRVAVQTVAQIESECKIQPKLLYVWRINQP
jgi:ribosomal protein L44E